MIGGILGQLDEMEYARLAAQVLEIEKLVNSGQPGDLGFLLRSFLHNAKARMEEIRHDEIRDIESGKERKVTEIAQAVHLTEIEHKLSVAEKQQYAEFLQRDYFTKAQFDDLEGFYAESWDRLSERGKNEMSTRVWEGIKRQEYTFDELPEVVRKKESERLYLQLTGAIEPTPIVQNLSPQARAEFVRAYEAGNENEASKVLSGGSRTEAAQDKREASVLAADVSARDPKSVINADKDVAPEAKMAKDANAPTLSGLTVCESDTVEVPTIPQVTRKGQTVERN